MSACICAANSSEGTYSPGNGAPAGGGLITWYIRTGTVAVPGLPVATPVTVDRGSWRRPYGVRGSAGGRGRAVVRRLRGVRGRRLARRSPPPPPAATPISMRDDRDDEQRPDREQAAPACPGPPLALSGEAPGAKSG